MSDKPDNPTLRMLRRLDEKMDRLLAEMADIKPRISSLEIGLGGVSSRLDRVEGRLDRIERRLDFGEATAG